MDLTDGHYERESEGGEGEEKRERKRGMEGLIALTGGHYWRGESGRWKERRKRWGE